MFSLVTILGGSILVDTAKEPLLTVEFQQFTALRLVEGYNTLPGIHPDTPEDLVFIHDIPLIGYPVPSPSAVHNPSAEVMSAPGPPYQAKSL